MKFISKLAPILALAAATAATLPAADLSFSGNWKLNLAKSRLSGQTFTIEKTPSGLYHFDTEGFGYDFDLTGKEFPTPDGGTTSWRASDATSWDGASRMNGKVIVSFHLTAKGDNLTFVMKANKPDGTAVDQTTENTRLSGGPGIPGKWKSKDVKGAPTTLEIVTDNANHITVKYPEFQQTCAGAFDGKPYILKTAAADSKIGLTFEKTGANAFRMTTIMNGKPFYKDVLTLSADGKTLTDDGNSVAVNEPVKAVYDRQ